MPAASSTTAISPLAQVPSRDASGSPGIAVAARTSRPLVSVSRRQAARAWPPGTGPGSTWPTLPGNACEFGVTQGALRTILTTVGLADVPDDRLLEKLAEVAEHYRKAAAEIGALRPENPVAKEHAAKASRAAASGDRTEARHHLRLARSAAAAAAEKARQLAREAEAAAEKQMLQAAQAASRDAANRLSCGSDPA